MCLSHCIPHIQCMCCLLTPPYPLIQNTLTYSHTHPSASPHSKQPLIPVYPVIPI